MASQTQLEGLEMGLQEAQEAVGRVLAILTIERQENGGGIKPGNAERWRRLRSSARSLRSLTQDLDVNITRAISQEPAPSNLAKEEQGYASSQPPAGRNHNDWGQH